MQEILKKIYDNLFENLLIEKKLKHNSIILSFIEMKSNDRFRLIEKSAISSNSFQNYQINEMKLAGYIRETEEHNHYTITANGIWLIESQTNILNPTSLIQFIDTKFFYFKTTKALSEKEKVVLFSMISARAFSKDSAVDLKMDSITMDGWMDILNTCATFLINMKIIKNFDLLIANDEWYQNHNEHPVSDFIRHTDLLPKKTKGFYLAPGKQQYYLDLYQRNTISKEHLIFLNKLIFDMEMKNKEVMVESINNFLRKIASEKSPSVFDIKSHIFIDISFEKIIKDAVKEAIILG